MSDLEPVSLPIGLRVLRRFRFGHKLGVLERIYGSALSRHGVAWVRTAHGPMWKLDLRNSSHRWMVFGDYEGSTGMNWLRQWLAPGGVVVDSGANIGQTVAYFGPLLGVRIFAFEPFAEASEWLNQCLARQTGWHVEVVSAGLHDAPGSLQLLIPDLAWEIGAQATLQAGWYGDRVKRYVTIPVLRLDDFLEERKIDRLRLWKLDVEGWEIHALTGALAALGRHAIDAVYIEVGSECLSRVREIADGTGYTIFRLESQGRLVLQRGPLEGTMNLIMLPADSRESLAVIQS
jgi:FkbM family methyltransferase